MTIDQLSTENLLESAWKSFLKRNYEESLRHSEEVISYYIKFYSERNKKQYSATEILKLPFIEKQFIRACFFKGVVLEKMDKTEEAEECWKQIPSDKLCEYWRLLGEMFSRYSDIIACYDQALQIDSTNLETLHKKGLLYEKIGKPADAKVCFRSISWRELLGFNLFLPIIGLVFGSFLIVIAANIKEKSWLSWVVVIPGVIVTLLSYIILRYQGMDSIKLFFKRF